MSLGRRKTSVVDIDGQEIRVDAIGAKVELLLALYDHLSAEIGELHDKIDRLTEKIEGKMTW